MVVSEFQQNMEKLMFFSIIIAIVLIVTNTWRIKNKKIAVAIISAITLFTTSICIKFYCELFFFFGFFNLAILVGTLPIWGLINVFNPPSNEFTFNFSKEFKKKKIINIIIFCLSPLAFFLSLILKLPPNNLELEISEKYEKNKKIIKKIYWIISLTLHIICTLIMFIYFII